jgi:hypothetical protein
MISEPTIANVGLSHGLYCSKIADRWQDATLVVHQVGEGPRPLGMCSLRQEGKEVPCTQPFSGGTLDQICGQLSFGQSPFLDLLLVLTYSITIVKLGAAAWTTAPFILSTEVRMFLNASWPLYQSSLFAKRLITSRARLPSLPKTTSQRFLHLRRVTARKEDSICSAILLTRNTGFHKFDIFRCKQ